jgi:hypothetical protein
MTRCRAAKLVRLVACVSTIWVLLAPVRPARGDGGIVRASRRSGPYVVTVFTTPTPLRVGRADVSLMVQTAETDRVVTDAETTIRLRKPGRGNPTACYPATRAQATNKLLAAAIVEFPSPGAWTVEADVKGALGSSHVQFTADVRAAAPRWVDLLPWITWPLGLIAAFAFREAVVFLRRRRPEERVRSSVPSAGRES